MSYVYAYVAGIIDAGGCFDIHRIVDPGARHGVKHKCDVYVRSQNKDVVDFLVRNVGGLYTLDNTEGQKYDPAYKWRLHGKKAGPFLELLLPFMQKHKKKAEIAIEFCKTINEKKVYHIDDEVFALREALFKQFRDFMDEERQRGRILYATFRENRYKPPVK